MNTIIAVDFDGTIVEHDYPRVGAPVPGALETLRTFNEKKIRIILWTMRDKEELAQAVEYLSKEGIRVWGVNKNPGQYSWTSSPKAYAPIYIDDAALGCPLVHPGSGKRPYVDWAIVNDMLSKMDIR